MTNKVKSNKRISPGTISNLFTINNIIFLLQVDSMHSNIQRTNILSINADLIVILMYPYLLCIFANKTLHIIIRVWILTQVWQNNILHWVLDKMKRRISDVYNIVLGTVGPATYKYSNCHQRLDTISTHDKNKIKIIFWNICLFHTCIQSVFSWLHSINQTHRFVQLITMCYCLFTV